MSLPLIVGLGSHCGDDRVGWIVIDRLRELGLPSHCLKQVRHSAQILDVIDVTRDLVVCDACEGPNSGTVHCWPWPSKGLTTRRCQGTHDIGLNEVLNLARQLNQSPVKIEVWAIEGCHWASPETSLTDAAGKAAEAIWSKYANA